MEELASGAESWRTLMAKGTRSVEALVDAGLVDKTEAERLAPIADRYELLVNRYYLSLIDPNDPNCPIRKQAIPALEELVVTPGELRDPIGDHAHAPTPILVHRYPDRALLFPTFRCPMFCRFCFRKVSLNEEKIKLREALPESLSYLRAHPEIKEIILSGGDPLLLSNERLNWLFSSIREAGVPRLRIHSRVPVTLPQRIDEGLVELLSTYQPLFLICHFNHPKELSSEADKALSALGQAGVPLLNQSTLLRGVNADPHCLRILSEGLLQRGVVPYYLHHPDLTPGTQHFRISLREGLEIMRELRGTQSGIGLPTYVIDIPEGGGKVPVESAWVTASDDPREWTLKSPLTGAIHRYSDLAEGARDTTT